MNKKTVSAKIDEDLHKEFVKYLKQEEYPSITITEFITNIIEDYVGSKKAHGEYLQSEEYQEELQRKEEARKEREKEIEYRQRHGLCVDCGGDLVDMGMDGDICPSCYY